MRWCAKDQRDRDGDLVPFQDERAFPPKEKLASVCVPLCRRAPVPSGGKTGLFCFLVISLLASFFYNVIPKIKDSEEEHRPRTENRHDVAQSILIMTNRCHGGKTRLFASIEANPANIDQAAFLFMLN